MTPRWCSGVAGPPGGGPVWQVAGPLARVAAAAPGFWTVGLRAPPRPYSPWGLLLDPSLGPCQCPSATRQLWHCGRRVPPSPSPARRPGAGVSSNFIQLHSPNIRNGHHSRASHWHERRGRLQRVPQEADLLKEAPRGCFSAVSALKGHSKLFSPVGAWGYASVGGRGRGF